MGSTPKSNPYQTAAAQQQAETGAAQASAIINNPNQYGPYGSRSYQQAGWETVYDAQGQQMKVPRYNETTRLSPDQMKLMGLQTQAQYNLGQTATQQSAKLGKFLNQSVSTQGLQPWQRAAAPGQLRSTIGNAGPLRQDQAPTNRAAVEAAMMGRWNRDAARQNAAEEAQLAARGMAPGSAQWGSVQEQQNRARTDALEQAFLASGQESRAAQQAYNAVQQQRFDEMAAQAQFGNQAAMQRYQMGSDWASQLNNMRQGQLQERLAMRNQPINEITALLSGSQVTQPQFAPFSRQGINAAPIANLIQNDYQARAQNSANRMQGLFGLGSAALSALPFP
jgi:hypothetical protein